MSRVTRLTREESRALTREKLLASAREVVAREGYESASVERIAEEAGFSKGAFYSNFNSKEEIILELLESHSLQDVKEITELLGDTKAPAGMIEIIGNWASQRASDPSWGLLALELFRRARRDATFGERHSNLFRAQWRGLGEILLTMFPADAAPADAETLGGIVFGLTYGSASSFKSGPGVGEMVKVVLSGLHGAHGKKRPAARKAV
ncbi:TetR/AcrR family transcriptional regulator [Pseudoduganella namucuonensis]|uniref:Transcriptional regulator, TetR family n=1 Tax=Pseudoduganella namucuonensis TaxID=1035707 RepID=A0A1I7LPN4_9BURK|nr:TetR/AcrR family transcriptional regulator [Pseudoduganella namucuonensis]SFV11589.1 transcriptional regulator, TetR family [Pseudoduganella namucuonensis]